MSNTKIFGNPGILDPMSFMVYGLSAKNKDDAIGQFGTGLKYAIAVMIREKLQISIKTPLAEFTFFEKEITFRDKKFMQIFCKESKVGGPDKEILLPFTTDFGKNWDLWQVYRELSSNCMDEDGVIGEEGQTTIYAELDVNHHDVFMPGHREILHETSDLEIREGESDFVYYQGIRVYQLEKPSFYTYNLKKAALTEDRTLQSFGVLHRYIADWCTSSNNLNLIKWFIHTRPEEYFERNIDFDYLNCTNNITETYVNYCLENPVMTEIVNQSALTIGLRKAKTGNKIIEKPFTDAQSEKIEKSLNSLTKMGYQIDYQVSLSDHLGVGVLAYADTTNEVIWLSSKIIDSSPRELCSAILEEYIHIFYQVGDYTRQMQNILFEEIIKQGIKSTGDYL